MTQYILILLIDITDKLEKSILPTQIPSIESNKINMMAKLPDKQFLRNKAKINKMQKLRMCLDNLSYFIKHLK